MQPRSAPKYTINVDFAVKLLAELSPPIFREGADKVKLRMEFGDTLLVLKYALGWIGIRLITYQPNGLIP